MSTKVPLVDMSDYDGQGCLDDMFRSQAKATPDAVAVVNVDGSIVGFVNILFYLLYLFHTISVNFSVFILSNFWISGHVQGIGWHDGRFGCEIKIGRRSQKLHGRYHNGTLFGVYRQLHRYTKSWYDLKFLLASRKKFILFYKVNFLYTFCFKLCKCMSNPISRQHYTINNFNRYLLCI